MKEHLSLMSSPVEDKNTKKPRKKTAASKAEREVDTNLEGVLDLQERPPEAEETSTAPEEGTELVTQGETALAEAQQQQADIDSIGLSETEANDFDKSQADLDDTIETTRALINEISVIANASQSPRAFEVAGKLIEAMGKTISLKSEVLLRKKAIQKAAKTLVPERQPNGVVNNGTVTNNTVYLSTAELLKQIAPDKNIPAPKVVDFESREEGATTVYAEDAKGEIE